MVVTSLPSPLSITLQSRVRLSRKLCPVLLAQKLAIWSHSNLDLNFPRLKAGFRHWLARSLTGSSPLFLLLPLTLFEERQDVAVPLSLSSSSTALHKASHPFTKLLSAVMSALNSSTGSCGLATMRFFPRLTSMRTLWVRMLLSIRAMWNSSVLWRETMEVPSRLRGTTTSRRRWILPSLLAGR